MEIEKFKNADFQIPEEISNTMIGEELEEEEQPKDGEKTGRQKQRAKEAEDHNPHKGGITIDTAKLGIKDRFYQVLDLSHKNAFGISTFIEREYAGENSLEKFTKMLETLRAALKKAGFEQVRGDRPIEYITKDCVLLTQEGSMIIFRTDKEWHHHSYYQSVPNYGEDEIVLEEGEQFFPDEYGQEISCGKGIHYKTHQGGDPNGSLKDTSPVIFAAEKGRIKEGEVQYILSLHKDVFKNLKRVPHVELENTLMQISEKYDKRKIAETSEEVCRIQQEFDSRLLRKGLSRERIITLEEKLTGQFDGPKSEALENFLQALDEYERLTRESGLREIREDNTLDLEDEDVIILTDAGAVVAVKRGGVDVRKNTFQNLQTVLMSSGNTPLNKEEIIYPLGEWKVGGYGNYLDELSHGRNTDETVHGNIIGQIVFAAQGNLSGKDVNSGILNSVIRAR